MVLVAARNFNLVDRGGAGLSCDDEGVTLGPVVLAAMRTDEQGQHRYEIAPIEVLARALALAYGVPPETEIERCRQGLQRVARSLERGDIARASMEAVLLRFPAIQPEGMAKLLAAEDLTKDSDAWQNQPRVPAGQTGGGQWTSGGEGMPTTLDAASAASDCEDPTHLKKSTFVNAHYGDALRVAMKLGVPVENILGVSALESGWGQSNFAAHQNYFGVHYPAFGAVNSFPTNSPNIRGAVFASYADCLGWFEHVAGASVRGKSDPSEFAEALQDSGRFGIDTSTGAKMPGYVSEVADTIRGLRSYLPRKN